MRIALQQNTDAERYDVYDVPGGEFRSFDDLVFVETVDSLPAEAQRINEDEPTNADYVAAYQVH